MVRRSFWRGIITGSLAAIAAGLWLLPRVNPDTRQMLREKGTAISGKTVDAVEAARYNMGNYLRRAK